MDLLNGDGAAVAYRMGQPHYGADDAAVMAEACGNHTPIDTGKNITVIHD